EKLVLEDWHQSPDYNNLKIARVKCLTQRNLEQLDIDTFAQGHISLVVVPENNNQIKNEENKYEKLFNFLDQRRLLTTRIHIVEPLYVSVAIEAKLVIHDGAQAEAVKNKAQTEVTMFFDTLKSGKYWQGKGWQFGRSIYLSELYKILDSLEGVDYVENLQIKDKDNNPQSEIYLAENQLVNFNLEDSQFTIVVEVGNEQKSI
ncbi:MAG: baseplate protein J, partial [Moorea sp. SIO2B7]|nr:baseplate protein J [Moorena sp. SIO2B7]